MFTLLIAKNEAYIYEEDLMQTVEFLYLLYRPVQFPC